MNRKKRLKPGRRLSRPAYLLIRYGLIASCLILAGALLLSVYTGPLTAHNVHTHRLIADLYRTPLGILLTVYLGALIIEDRLQ